MAACLGAHPALRIRGAQSLVLSNLSPRQPCGSIPVVRIGARERRRGGVAVCSLGGFSSFTDETPVRDTGVKEIVDSQIADASQEFAEMDLEEAAEKYNLQEQLFTEVDYCQINTFTDRAFSGNPAAVIFLPYERDDRWLQTIAREFNQTTAFLVKRYNTRNKVKNQKRKGLVQVDESGKGLKSSKTFDPLPVENEFDLRWFSPTAELDLCGHATLASAHLLFSANIVEGDTALFHTKAGVLTANKVSGYEEFEEAPEGAAPSDPPATRKPSSKGVIELDFPLVAATECNEASILSEALGGVDVKWIGKSNLGDYLVELQSSEDVEKLNPKFERMMDFPGRGGVIVTAPAAASSEYDFISRFFCPKMGINEDPATGSAHCTLGPYWASKLGKTELNAYQASSRGGKFLVRVDEEAGRCYLQGGSILVMLGICLNTKQI
ncbi:hypothetical protein M758_11G036600 [Ceratodon purpureus]|nr:hypothetical protein M758_11G036600 [Ceratodon purpureus]